MVNQSTQTNPPPLATDDTLAHDFLQDCGTAAVELYHQGRSYCMGVCRWITRPDYIKTDHHKFV